MYARILVNETETRRFTIRDAGTSGWEVREEQGSEDQGSHVIRRVLYKDWHRVERAKASFAITAASLEEAGWRESS